MENRKEKAKELLKEYETLANKDYSYKYKWCEKAIHLLRHATEKDENIHFLVEDEIDIYLINDIRKNGYSIVLSSKYENLQKYSSFALVDYKEVSSLDEDDLSRWLQILI